MEFYHQLVTEKSFKLLQDLRKKYKFILIGGWAVFLYSKALKSKDIDIIVDYDELEKIRNDFDLHKNDRLKKYEIKIQEVDVDIYLPYFSNLGMPVEEIKKYTQSIEGFFVPTIEMLLILKTYTYRERKGTTKGQKDLIDIFSLIKEKKINWGNYKKLIAKYKFTEINKELKNLVSKTVSIPELNISNHQMARLRREILEKL